MTPTLLHPESVAERLGTSVWTLRRMMTDTRAAGLAQPWIAGLAVACPDEEVDHG